MTGKAGDWIAAMAARRGDDRIQQRIDLGEAQVGQPHPDPMAGMARLHRGERGSDQRRERLHVGHSTIMSRGCRVSSSASKYSSSSRSTST
jgi:hypothetical protein